MNKHERIKRINTDVISRRELVKYADEAEVYHVENRETRKIVFTFSCNSWTKASEIAMLKLYKRNGEDK